MSEKTEEPTDKKLEDARKKGQVAQSKDLSSSFAFVFAVGTLMLTGSMEAERVRQIISMALEGASATGDDRPALSLVAAQAMALDAVWIVFPVLGAAALGSWIGGLAHVGFNFSAEPLVPKLDRLDPAQGVKRMFSLKTLFEAGKSAVQALFIGWVLYGLIRSLIPVLVVSGYGIPENIGANAWAALTKLWMLCATLFVVLGVIDFIIQSLLFLKDQKMTKDEVKREYKESEGDPQLKGERKALAKEIAFSDPSPAVATANAVVVNPTHYAVALRYEPSECGLPVVVAKGVDGEAALIRDAAKQHGVPIIGNPPLARALYLVATNATVPEPLLEAVAIVLRWAQQLRGEEQS